MENTFFAERGKILEVLSHYCSNIHRCASTDDRENILILGSYISMRKALEVMSVDVLRNFTCPSSQFYHMNDIDAIRMARKYGSRGGFGRLVTNADFAGISDGARLISLHSDMSDLYARISVHLHYQGYRYNLNDEVYSRPSLREAEIAQVSNAYTAYNKLEPQFRPILKRYLELTRSEDEAVHFSALSNFDRNIADVVSATKDRIEKLANNEDVEHPILEFCAEILQACEEEEDSLIHMDSLYISNRLIAECYCYDTIACNIDAKTWIEEEIRVAESNHREWKPTLQKYIDKLNGIENNNHSWRRRERLAYGIRTGAAQEIQNSANNLDHIAGFDYKDDLLQYNANDRAGFIETTKRINTSNAMLLQAICNEKQPGNIKAWLNSHAQESVQLRKELIEKDDKLRRLQKEIKSWKLMFFGVLGIFVLGVIVFLVHQINTINFNKVSTKYYADYIWRDNVPEGFGQALTDAQRSSYASCYEIDTQRGFVREVRHVNSSGVMVDEMVIPDRYARIAVNRSDDNSLSDVEFYDADNIPVYSLHYADESIAQIGMPKSIEDITLPADWTNLSLSAWRERQEDDIENDRSLFSQIRAIEVTERYESGQAKTVKAANGKTDCYGVRGYTVSYYEDGRIKSVIYSYMDDTDAVRPNSVLKKQYEYSGDHIARISIHCTDPEYDTTEVFAWNAEENAIESINYVDMMERPVANRAGVASIQYEYDNGNIICIRYLGLDGQLVMGPEGFAQKKLKYDEKGRTAEEEYNDTNGVLLVCGDNTWAKRTVSYSEDGSSITEYRYDKHGDLFDICQIVTEAMEEDGKYSGYVETNIKCDMEGNPVSQVRSTYDKTGMLQKTEYLDGEGDYDTEREYAIERFTYNGQGQIELVTYEAEEDVAPLSGTHYKRYTYDSYGRKQDCQYTFVEGSDATENSYDETKWISDDNAHTWEKQFFMKGSLADRGDGIAIIRATYDENGKMQEFAVFDENNEPTIYPSIEGYGVRYSYDEFGRNRTRTYLDAAGNPMVSPVFGCATITFEYDDNNKVIRETYLDADGNPMESAKYGSYARTWNYDDHSQLTDHSHMDQTGDKIT